MCRFVFQNFEPVGVTERTHDGHYSSWRLPLTVGQPVCVEHLMGCVSEWYVTPLVDSNRSG